MSTLVVYLYYQLTITKNNKMIPSQILNDKNLASDLADVLGYGEITGSESLMIHKNSNEFKLASQDRVGYMLANQGWVECVSADTLVSILGIGETTDEGLVEGEKVANWMKSQN